MRDFGVFDVLITKARKARNPRTGAEAMAPERRRVSFKAGKHVKERVTNAAAR